MTPQASPPAVAVRHPAPGRRWRQLLAPALCTLLMASLLVGLGVWQLRRLAWKEALIARIEARAHAAPQPLPPPADWPAMAPGEYEFRHVAVDGAFDHAAETLILRASPDGPGYHVVTPLRLAGGGAVLVDRGFVPLASKAPASRAAGQIAGPVHLTGLLRAPEPRNLFTPADRDGTFFTRDPAAIAAFHHLAGAAPFSIDADAGTPTPGGLPKAVGAELALPNNHLSYALTWFGLALGLAGVFAAYALRRLAPADAPGDPAPAAADPRPQGEQPARRATIIEHRS